MADAFLDYGNCVAANLSTCLGEPDVSPAEHVAAFIAEMEACGIPPAEPIADRLYGGELIRFDVVGDRKGRQNGWAVLHLDGRPAGAFGTNKGGACGKWRAHQRPRRMSAEERAEQRRRVETLKTERAFKKQAAQSAAADIARSMWDRAAVAAAPGHGYLRKKGIAPENIRQHRAHLLVPMCDIGGTIWNVQRIDHEGGKLFLKGGRIAGLMWCCGDPDAVICIGEGFGTMARVRKATGHAVVAAFTEKNLEPVSRLVRDRHPDLDIIICADDDAHLVDHPQILRNVGLDAAHAAAAAVGGRVAMPPRGN